MKIRKSIKVKGKIIDLAKNLLSKGFSQREVADKLNVSQYTVWCISKGSYDSDEPLVKKQKEKIEFFNW